MKTIFNCQLLLGHGPLNVLLVCEDEDGCFFQILIYYDFKQFCLSYNLVLDIGAINDKNYSIGFGVICLPNGSQSFLAS